MSERSHPDYYANSDRPEAQKYHAHRQLLQDVMLKADFQRNPREWWHFSIGDQMWAWLNNQSNPAKPVTARYGRLV
jgi:D-alanyl-D-alanine dipeptidase